MRDGFCLDCERNLVPTGEDRAEWFAVTDEVWAATGLPLHGMERGNLCVGCLEDRLGRRLVPADFSDAPINDLSIAYGERAWSWRTDRLTSRLSGEQSAAHPDLSGTVEDMTTNDPAITVTLSVDDFWRIRQALNDSAVHHEQARSRCTGTNQRSTDTILHHEHILRRLEDVESLLIDALNDTMKAKPKVRTAILTDREDGVIIDSLAFMRDHLEGQGIAAPNVRSALGKFAGLMTPSTGGVRLEAIEGLVK